MTDTYINVIQQLQLYIEKMEIRFSAEGVLGREPYQSILEEIKGIISNLNDPTITKPIDNLELVSSPLLEIDRLGLGELVSLYVKEEINVNRIAEILQTQGYNITFRDINTWLSSVNGKGLLDRPQISGFGSVFDSEVQLQSIFDRLRHLEIELDSEEEEKYLRTKTTKKQIQRELISEVRATIKDATNLAKSMQSQDDLKEIQRIIIHEINQESPTLAMRIWRRLKERSGAIS